MPARYVKMRDAMIREGKAPKLAKKIAAIKYNKTRKQGEPPLSNKPD